MKVVCDGRVACARKESLPVSKDCSKQTADSNVGSIIGPWVACFYSLSEVFPYQVSSTNAAHAYNGLVFQGCDPLMLKLLSKLPLPVLYLFSGVLYCLLYYVVRYRRKVVAAHLQQAFPDKCAAERKLIAKKFYRGFSDVTVEALYSGNMSREEVSERVQFKNIELLESLLDQGSSFILLGGHCCNWEWLLLSIGAKLPIPVNAVYKPLHNKSVDRFMLETRSRFNVEPIPHQEFMNEVVKRKRSQRVYGILADQRPRNKGRAHITQFLNRETRCFIGPEKIAQFVKIPVVFMKMTRLSRGRYQLAFELLAEPPYKKERDSYPLTERYIRKLEEQIMETPEDWLWSNRRWK